jgi:hypothetical protein
MPFSKEGTAEMFVVAEGGGSVSLDCSEVAGDGSMAVASLSVEKFGGRGSSTKLGRGWSRR